MEKSSHPGYSFWMPIEKIPWFFCVHFDKIENWLKFLYILFLSLKIRGKLNWHPAVTLSAELHFKMFKNSGSGEIQER